MSIRIDGTNTSANPGITGADTDTGLQFGTNEVKVVTDGSDRVTVDSNGRLGIGETSPIDLLHIKSDSGNANVRLTTGDTSSGFTGVIFGDTDDTNTAAVQYDHSNNSLQFESNNAERMRILSDGTIRLTSNCPGIDFSQLQSDVSGMQSETLSGYEEGTFTPRLVIENGGDVTVYSNKKGCYVKVGSTVTAWFNLTVDGTPSNRSTSNAIEFHDLPFTSTDDDSGGAAMYIGSVRINGVNTSSTYNDMSEGVIRLNNNNTMGRIELREASTSALRNSSLFLKDNTAIFATITYRTDA